ncbi:MAG: glycerate kinase [Bacillota bacterium]
MHILIAMDSFKGSLSAYQLNQTIKETLLSLNNTLKITTLPIADGGEGTLDALQHLPHAKRISLTVHNPLMKPIKADYLIIDNTAIIEMAQASGLPLLKPHEQNPLYTTTYGVGEIIKDAIKKQVKIIIITVGGSATHDGGIGCMTALGYEFLDTDHHVIDPVGNNLGMIASIDSTKRISIPHDVQFHVACDVTNPLTGTKGAAYIYAKQKGAAPKEILHLEQGLTHYKRLLKKDDTSLDTLQPGLGAAGGLPLSLIAFLNAKLSSGANLIFDMLHVDKTIKSSDLIITGEGKVDRQTFHNKAVFSLLKRAQRYHKPSIILGGVIEKEAYALINYGAFIIKSIHNTDQITKDMLTEAYTKKRLKITLKSLAHLLK